MKTAGAPIPFGLSPAEAAAWERTANAVEVNAIYDGDFAIQPEHTTTPTALVGWNNPEGLRQLIKNAENDPGLAYASQGAGFFAWGNTSLSYGATTGYTMPLAAHTVYELKFKTAGWRDGDMGYVRASVLNSSSEGLSNTNSATATKRINNDSENPWVEFSAVFETGEAGDYTLGMWTSKHAVITDITLYQVPAQTVTISARGFSTLYTGYALDFSKATPATTPADDLTAYTGTYSKEIVAEEVIETLTLEPVDEVPANTGVVLKGTAGTTYNVPVIASSSTEKGDLTGSVTDDTDVETLKSTYDFYGLAWNSAESKVQFTLVSGGTIAAGKAFLKLDKGAGAKVLRVVVDGQASEVTAPEVVETEEPEVLYNMAGIPVGKDFKGYVINQKGEKRLQR